MSITPKSIPYTRPWLADYQLSALFNDKRYALIEGSTKAGKTAPCLIWFFEQAALYGGPGKAFWWVAPVYSQAEIAYSRFIAGIPKGMCKPHNTDKRVELANGAKIWFKSAEKADNLYGDDVYAAVVDEASRIDDDSWYALRSTLTATRGKARIIGNVKGRKNWFYKMCRQAERGDPDMAYAKITALDAIAAGILDSKEIDDARRNLPDHVFRELYMAEPSGGEGRVYRDFSNANVDPNVKDHGGTIWVGMDFNINPMSACIGSKIVDELHLWSEITINNANTEQMCQEILRRFPKRQIVVYPDPAGNSRKTSAAVGQTDFSILRQHGFTVLAPKSHPAIADRVNTVNAMIRNSEGRRRLRVHPSCKAVIAGLEDQMYKEGTSIPDKAGGLDHMNDALGYLCTYEFPIVSTNVKFAKVVGF